MNPLQMRAGQPELAGSSRLDTGPTATVDLFPLSFLQETLWLVEQMVPGSSAYNLAEGWRLRGQLDPASLQAALDTLVRRHEVLRTVMGITDGRPVQVIRPSGRFALEIADLRESRQAGEWEGRFALEARRPFDLRRGPLARATLFRLAEDDHVLLLAMHHIISDEWSFEVFRRELAEVYTAKLTTRPVALPELPIQYADFAVWQRDVLGSEWIQKQLSYWETKLAQPLPVLALPTDRTRPAANTLAGASEFFHFDRELTEGLKGVSQRHGATLFITLLAAYQTLLHRYTRQEDVIVGTPMAGRGRLETEGLLGFFANTHALRTDLSGDPAFTELLSRVRENVLGAYAHQEVTVDKILERLRPERQADRHPLFQTVLALQPAQLEDWELPGVSVSRVEVDNGGSKFDWSLLVTETRQGLAVRSEYSTDLFEAGTVRQWVGQFEALLRGIVAEPQRKLSEFELLSDLERQRFITELNPKTPCVASDVALTDWFEQQAARTPTAVALVCGDTRLTYEELNRRANQLAHYLQQRGVGPETPVALCLERSLEMVIAILAVLKAGGYYVPLEPAAPVERIRFVLQDTHAPVLITQQHLRTVLPAESAGVLCVDLEQDKIGEESADNLGTKVNPGQTAYVIYTSGSTGQPKGVLVTHRNVARLFQQTQPWFEFGSHDVWTLFHSYTFDFSVWELWGALLYGGRLVVVPYLVSRSPNEFLQLLAGQNVTVLNQTPSAFRQLIWAETNARAARSLNLRYVIFGGEALELQSLRPWFERHGDERPRLVNMYGITETTVHVTYRPLRQSDLERGLGSVIGVPIPDLRLYLLDESLRHVPPGVAGEICVGGAGVARGYLNRPELTEKRFVPDPFAPTTGGRLYRSGDLGRYTSKGELEYLGRLDDQVKVRGHRVELGEIEAWLNRHVDVKQSVVLAQPEAGGGKTLLAYIVTAGEARRADHWRAYLCEKLPDYMVPGRFILLKELPLTTNGKVDRRALARLATEEPDHQDAGGGPRNRLEKLVAETWCALLGRKEIGIQENFFHLGGHSLMATQAIARLGAALELELSVRLLFDAPTVAGLAEQLGRLEQQEPAAGAVIRPRQPADSSELNTLLEQLTPEELDDLLAVRPVRTVST